MIGSSDKGWRSTSERNNTRYDPGGCQGVPNRWEFRAAATGRPLQCERSDRPAALAAYLNSDQNFFGHGLNTDGKGDSDHDFLAKNGTSLQTFVQKSWVPPYACPYQCSIRVSSVADDS